MSLQDFTNNPDFRRQSNAVTDSVLKILGRALTAGFMAVINFLKSIVLMAFGK